MASELTDDSHDLEIARLVIRQGVKPRRIAEKLRISESKARSALKRIRRQWMRRMDQSFDRLIAEEVARLDEVERAAWEGWDRSLRDEISQTSKDISGSDSDKHEATIKRTSKAGAPAFLATIASAVKQRSELLGLVDEDARNASRNSDDSQVVPIVVGSREEAESLKTLSIEQFRKASKAGEPDGFAEDAG